MDKILLTGGAGYIGSHTLRHLLDIGIPPSQLVVYDNLSTGHCEFIPNGVRFIQGDILNTPMLVDVVQNNSIQFVIHFAAHAYVGESMRDPSRYFRNNISGGISLLEALRGSHCKGVVFSSTCSMYGVPQSMPIIEDSPIDIMNPYAETKRAFERLLQWYKDIYGLSYVSLRYFNAAGAGFGIGERHEPETHLVPLAIRAALGTSSELKVFGGEHPTPDGTCVRDYVHVLDLAAAHYQALEFIRAASSPVGEIVNLGTGEGNSVRQVLDMIADVSGRSVPHSVVDARDGDPPILIADNAKARNILGWLPRKKLRSIIESAWEWHEHQE